MYRQEKCKKDQRKRGRPSGKNRVPLSLEERRARNAQYERERRNETADAMAQLAEAAGCGPNMKNTDVMGTVLCQIHKATAIAQIKEENIDFLSRTNNNIRAQIAQLQAELMNMPGVNIEDLPEIQELLAPESDSEEETSASWSQPSGSNSSEEETSASWNQPTGSNSSGEETSASWSQPSGSNSSEEESEPARKKIKTDSDADLLSVSPTESVELAAAPASEVSRHDDLDALLGPFTDEDNAILSEMMQQIGYF